MFVGGVFVIGWVVCLWWVGGVFVVVGWVVVGAGEE